MYGYIWRSWMPLMCTEAHTKWTCKWTYMRWSTVRNIQLWTGTQCFQIWQRYFPGAWWMIIWRNMVFKLRGAMLASLMKDSTIVNNSISNVVCIVNLFNEGRSMTSQKATIVFSTRMKALEASSHVLGNFKHTHLKLLQLMRQEPWRNPTCLKVIRMMTGSRERMKRSNMIAHVQ